MAHLNDFGASIRGSQKLYEESILRILSNETLISYLISQNIDELRLASSIVLLAQTVSGVKPKTDDGMLKPGGPFAHFVAHT